MNNLSDTPETSRETSLTVFFDGDCPLCQREIAWYKKQKGAERIDWQDVSQSSSENVAVGLCTTDALKRFHVQKQDGSIVSGALAFSEVWRQLPLFKPLGVLVGLPVVSTAAEWMYRFFLTFRPSIQRFFR